MADSVEMQDIRGLDIDKAVKGFALTEYIFKDLCTVSSTTGDSIRWYQETAADLTATTPSVIKNVSPLSSFPTLEASWTRQTSYVKKYAAECFISMEDIKSADIDVLSRTLLRLTRAVTKQVDADIYNVLTENQTVVNINTNAASAAWNTASWTGVDIVEDLTEGIYNIQNQGYDTKEAVLLLSPLDYRSMVTWLISSKGASIPNFSSALMGQAAMTNILGLSVRVSPNVVADSAAIIIPKKAATWKSHTDITSRAIEDAGIGTKLRVWEIGIALLTDPKAVNLITNTQT